MAGQVGLTRDVTGFWSGARAAAPAADRTSRALREPPSCFRDQARRFWFSPIAGRGPEGGGRVRVALCLPVVASLGLRVVFLTTPPGSDSGTDPNSADMQLKIDGQAPGGRWASRWLARLCPEQLPCGGHTHAGSSSSRPRVEFRLLVLVSGGVGRVPWGVPGRPRGCGLGPAWRWFTTRPCDCPVRRDMSLGLVEVLGDFFFLLKSRKKKKRASLHWRLLLSTW